MPSVTLHSGNVLKSVPLKAKAWSTPRAEFHSGVELALERIDTEPLSRATSVSIDQDLRSRYQITAKVFLGTNPSPDHVRDGIDVTLKKLKTQTVETVLLSPLPGIDFDIETFLPIWQEVESLVNKNVASRIGVCDFNRADLQQLYDRAIIKPKVNQVHYATDNDGIIEFARDHGITLLSHARSDEDTLTNPSDISSTLEKHYSSPTWTPAWAVRYSVMEEDRGIVHSRGYVVHCSNE